MNKTDLILFSPDEADLEACGGRFATVCRAPLIVFLVGDLGAGKTTFSRGFLRGLHYEGRVKSPTYTLVESYAFSDKTIYHFDLYRLQDPEELEFMGIQDYMTPTSIALIEWPEKGSGFLPPPDISCYIEYKSTGRALRFVSSSEQGAAALKRFRLEMPHE